MLSSWDRPGREVSQVGREATQAPAVFHSLSSFPRSCQCRKMRRFLRPGHDPVREKLKRDLFQFHKVCWGARDGQVAFSWAGLDLGETLAGVSALGP